MRPSVSLSDISLLTTLVQFSPDLMYALRMLIEQDGAVKVRNIVQSSSLPQHVLDLTQEYCQRIAAFRSEADG